MKINKSSLSKMLYTAFILVFVIYLFAANSLVLNNSLYSNNKFKKINIEDYKNNDTQTFAGVDDFYLTNDTLDTFYILGWVHIDLSEYDKKPAEINYNDKKIYMVLNGDTSYIAPSDQIYRSFYLENIADNRVNPHMHGFRTKFSALNVKNGVYEICVYTEEDGLSGITSTNLFIEKTARGIESVYGEKVENIVSYSVNHNMLSTFDLIRRDDAGKNLIDGWSYIPETNSQDNIKYMVFENIDGDKVTMEAQTKKRIDVADVYGEDTLYSGYTVEIPKEMNKWDRAVCTIIIKNGNEFFSNEKSIVITKQDSIWSFEH